MCVLERPRVPESPRKASGKLDCMDHTRRQRHREEFERHVHPKWQRFSKDSRVRYWKLKELIPPIFQWLKALLPQTFSQVHRKFVFETKNDHGRDSRYLGNTDKGLWVTGQAVGKLLLGLLWASRLTPQKSLAWHFLTWKCFNSLLLANYPQGLRSGLALREAHVWFDGLWQACLAKKKILPGPAFPLREFLLLLNTSLPESSVKT